MNYKIFLLTVLLSLSSSQCWDWGIFDVRNGGSNTILAANAYFDYYVAFIAGRTYNIFVYGYKGFDTTLTATDPSGYQAFNDDWGGSYYANGVYNTGSSMLDFTPTTSGVTQLRTQAKVSSDTGQFYLYIIEVSCSANCASCVATNGVCSMCQDGKKCSSCPSGQFQLEGTCTGTCPPGTYGSSSVCQPCSSVGEYCTSCSSTACLSCLDPYVLTGSSCTCAYGCSACNTDGSCSSCLTGYFPFDNGCVSSCPSGYYESNSACYVCPTGCATCTSSTVCTSCSSGLYLYASTCVSPCPSGYYGSASVCYACATGCTACSSSASNACSACSSGFYLYGSTCVSSCPSGYYGSERVCYVCPTGCSTCTSSTVCTACSSGLYLYESTCISPCPSGYYGSENVCYACPTECTTCSSATVCTACSSGFYLYESTCVSSCPSGYYGSERVCYACLTECTTCSSLTVCTACSSDFYLYDSTCISPCPNGYYGSENVCYACPIECTICSSSTTCTACSSGFYLYESTCVSSCPSTTYNDGVSCIFCSNLDSYCTACKDSKTCTSCSNSRLIYGATCLTSCPQGYVNTAGVCTALSLKVTLSNTDSVNNYLVEITSALVYDIDVVSVSKVTLVGVDPSAYTYTLTKQSETSYLISIHYTRTIISTTLEFVYTLTGTSSSTKNINIGEWTDQITSKYMAYMSESTKKSVEAVSSVAGGSMKGASVGASSMAVIGGNPALLWTLMNLFQQFYYLSFIDVNFPANVQMFLEIFSLGSLSFIPNPLEWFVKNINVYNLPVPQRYNDQSFSGLFLDNAGNELLLLSFVFIVFCACIMMKKWVRRLPTSLRFASNKCIGWFQWSGILESMVTSYTDIAQAAFLQLKVLTFTSRVFVLSSLLCFITLGFIVVFPVLVIMIIRRYNDHPELLTIQYETLVKEYKIDKVAARNYVPIWLIRRLIMCLSLVFLQGYPYVQINVLSILMIAGIYYCWVYTPYTTRKENICNTLMEILFGAIHVVIYILVYDDHNPYFSDDQRLQLGWVMICCCGAILILSLGLSLFEQIRMIIRGIRMLKQLMSKKEKVRVKVKKGEGKPSRIEEDSLQTDQSTLVDLNIIQTDTSLSPIMRPSPLPRGMALEKRLRRARIAARIRELRAMNS